VDASLPSFHASPARPGFRLPAGACDTHVHVFGPVSLFPYAPDAPFRPHEAPKEKLFAMHAMLGIERCVIVQSSCHGFDNRVVADVLRAKNGAYLGVALVPASADAAALKGLAAQGFRGVRFNFMRHLGSGAKIEDVVALTRRLEPLGLHLQVHFESSLIHELAPWFRKSAVPVVVDHMARIDASGGLDQPDFRALLDLLQDDRVHVKVSGSERCSKLGPPYEDAVPFARKLVAEFGDRTLWGTDWPHPNLNHVPDDGRLADLLLQIAPAETQRQALLVDNPGRFYRFAATRP
jgi:2-pyrone-4,6-dicarboxylate lactonase